MAKMEKLLRLKWDMTSLFAGLDRYSELVAASFEKTARLVAMDGLGKMVEHAPVQTGFLRGSGSVHVNGNFAGSGIQAGADHLGHPVVGKISAPKTSTAIVWGFNTFYAAEVHENPFAGARGGGPKFVELPLRNNQKRWMAFFASELKKAGTSRG